MDKTLQNMTIEELEIERTNFQNKIDGDENDGRTTAHGSYSLDYWMDVNDPPLNG